MNDLAFLLLKRATSIYRRLVSRTHPLKGPLADGEKFIMLTDDYLDSFDEIVVIGDIHGCSDELEELLVRVHTETPSQDPSKCLKILVGDLVNKGPNSLRVLELCRDIYHKSIISVRGNHDDLVLDLHNKYKSGERLSEKNKWIESLPARYISYLEKLPYTITIPSLNCVIVHAGLQPAIEDPAKNTPTELMTTMRNIVVMENPETKDHFYRCTKSNQEGAPWATFWSGPEHIYFGHDARRRLQNQHEFATGLDTGCVYGDKLSYVYIKGPRNHYIGSIKAKKDYTSS